VSPPFRCAPASSRYYRAGGTKANCTASLGILLTNHNTPKVRGSAGLQKQRDSVPKSGGRFPQAGLAMLTRCICLDVRRLSRTPRCGRAKIPGSEPAPDLHHAVPPFVSPPRSNLYIRSQRSTFGHDSATHCTVRQLTAPPHLA
jgi:hypothetical protein